MSVSCRKHRWTGYACALCLKEAQAALYRCVDFCHAVLETGPDLTLADRTREHLADLAAVLAAEKRGDVTPENLSI